jgi:hypothetical protein
MQTMLFAMLKNFAMLKKHLATLTTSDTPTPSENMYKLLFLPINNVGSGCHCLRSVSVSYDVPLKRT